MTGSTAMQRLMESAKDRSRCSLRRREKRKSWLRSLALIPLSSKLASLPLEVCLHRHRLCSRLTGKLSSLCLDQEVELQLRSATAAHVLKIRSNKDNFKKECRSSRISIRLKPSFADSKSKRDSKTRCKRSLRSMKILSACWRSLRRTKAMQTSKLRIACNFTASSSIKTRLPKLLLTL